MLATVAWVQTALTMQRRKRSHVEHGHDHVPEEHGIMAIGTGGLSTLEQAAARSGYSEAELRIDLVANVMGAAALLADRRGDDWRSALVAYGGGHSISGAREAPGSARRRNVGARRGAAGVWVWVRALGSFRSRRHRQPRERRRAGTSRERLVDRACG